MDGTRVKGGTRCEIEMGEVRVTLVKSSNGEIDMSVDGKAYGRVKAGDSVVVDKARTVAVNGAPRKSQ